jgi:ATP synthase protein I
VTQYFLQKRYKSMQENNAPQVEQDTEFAVLTAEQAQEWRKRNPTLSPWKVIALQAAIGFLVASITGVVFGSSAVAWSAAYGSGAVILPACMFAYSIRLRKRSDWGGAMSRFAIWQVAKLILTIALLAMAPSVVQGLNWLALLGGFVVTMKAIWLAVWVLPKLQKQF